MPPSFTKWSLTPLGSLSPWCFWWAINKTCAICVRWARKKVRGWQLMDVASSTSSLLLSATKRWLICSQSWCAMPAWAEKLKTDVADPVAPSPWLSWSTMCLASGGNQCEQLPVEEKTCMDTSSATIVRDALSFLLKRKEEHGCYCLVHAIIFKMSYPRDSSCTFWCDFFFYLSFAINVPAVQSKWSYAGQYIKWSIIVYYISRTSMSWDLNYKQVVTFALHGWRTTWKYSTKFLAYSV